MSELSKMRAVRAMCEAIKVSKVPSRFLERRSVWLSLGLLLAAACESERLKPQPLTDPVETYWDLELNHHAVTLALTAPYDTISLTATPRNFQGKPLSGLPAPVYRSSSPDRVLVGPNGTVVALQPTPLNGWAIVYATLTVGNLKHKDSVFVRVVDVPNPPVLTTFSVHPIPPDSAKSAVAAIGQINDPHGENLNTLVRATDASGSPLSDLLVDFRSSDPTTADILFLPNENKLRLVGNRVGEVTLYASVTAFGVSKADTLPYRIGWPLLEVVYIRPVSEGSSVNTFVGPEVTIGTGGYIAWVNFANTAMDIVFADPANVAPYNTSTLYPADYIAFQCAFFGIDCSAAGSFVLPPATPNGLSVAFRSFPTPGVYEYHSADGVSGRVIVVDER